MSNLSGNTFKVQLPGQAAGTLVQFYVEGRDALNAVSFFPAAGINSRALYRVNDEQAVSALRNFRVLMTQNDATILHAPTNVLSNDSLGATVIDDEQEVFYDVGVRLKGSFVGRNVARVGFTISFDPTQLFRGVHPKVAIDRSQHTAIGQAEIIAKHIASHAGGIPNMYDDLVHFIAPRAQDTSRGQLRMAAFDDIFLDSQFENGSDGQMYEFETPRFSGNTSDGTPEGIKLPGNGFVNLDIADRGDNKETYRWNLLQSNNRTEDDYSRIIAMAKAFSLTGTNLDAQTQQVMDVDQWMRVFAYQSLLGVGDAYFTGNNRHNMRMYVRPADQKVLAMPWDWDSSFSRSTTASLVGIDNLAKIVNLPNNLRVFHGHLYDLISTTFNASYLSRWTQHYGALANQDFSGILNYITQRGDFVLGQLPTATPFAITSNNGDNFETNQTPITLTGTASIKVKTIRVNGVSYVLDWTTLTNWSFSIPLNHGTNALVLQGMDASNNEVSGATKNITIINTAGGALVPVGMADNAGPGGFADPLDGAFQDWFELFNPNNSAVDLSGFFLTDNLSQPMKWKIPANTTIGANGFLLVWADGQTNQNGMGTNGDLHASFSLSKEGESLGLFAPDGITPQSTLTFGPQLENVSEGFYPDGNTNNLFVMTNFTPRQPNIPPAFHFTGASVSNEILSLNWEAIPGEIYQVQFKTNLAAGDWINLGPQIFSPGSFIQFTNAIGADAQRFYRVQQVE